ncbi:MAG: calcium/sodium antiporter [Congregibacter sp.]|nr:calcium/sodium antiporter [Congregibacter sp.]MDP5070033.1 calcium/sodium antiporter [Congregibacter sp.]
MLIGFVAVVLGLVILIWSATRFVDSAASLAQLLGMSPLLIGIVIVGFGTSAPEMVVSVIAASEGASGIALGNAYGSNIANIALILGITALIHPIAVRSVILRKELPMLLMVTALSVWVLWDLNVSRLDAMILLAVFALVMVWTITEDRKSGSALGVDSLNGDVQAALAGRDTATTSTFVWLLVALTVLIASSRLLVWGAVEIAEGFGVSDLIIGLTVIAVGTSMPEFATSIVAARKGQVDIALGNIIGSNIFNTLVVVGLAGAIDPGEIPGELLSRDAAVMTVLSVALFVMAYGFKKPGNVGRVDGTILLTAYCAYTAYLAFTVF